MISKRMYEFYQNQPPDFDIKAESSPIFVQRFWRNEKNRWVLNNICSGKVLDIGCGSGAISSKIKDVVGIDISKDAIQYCKKNHNGNYIVSLGEALPFKKESFDAVICSDVIEHIFEPKRLLEEIKHVLKKDGLLVVITPNYFSLWPIFELFWDTFGVRFRYKEQHVNRFNYFIIKRLLTETGFKVTSLESHFFLTPILSIFSEKLTEKVYAYEKMIRYIPVGALFFILARC